MTVAEPPMPFRHGVAWQRVEARRAMLFLAAASLLTWVQLSSGPVRLAPLVVATGLVLGDLAATMWSARSVEIATISRPSSLDGEMVLDLHFRARAPFMVDTLHVFGSHHLGEPIGGLDDRHAEDDCVARARCAEGQPDAVTAITLDVGCHTLGLFSLVRTHAVVLDSPQSIFVATDPVAQIRSQGEDRVRAYQAGDARNRIHWPVTARTGELHVRATDPDGFEQLTVVVEVVEAAQRQDLLRRAFDQIGAALAAGRLVRLVTFGVSERERCEALERLLNDPGRRGAAANLERVPTAVVIEGLVHDRNALVGRLASCRMGAIPPFGPDEVRIT